MKYIGQLLGWILLGVNSLLILLLWVCAYSPYVDPVVHPVLSCAGLAFPAFLLANVLFLFFWLVVYRRYALVPLLGFLCCYEAVRTYLPINIGEDDAPEGAIKVLSYNTMAFGGKAHTKEKPNEVLEYLANSNADIICLQEHILQGKLKQKDVDYALRNYRYKHFQKISGHNGLGIYSRYPILSARRVNYESAGNGSVVYRIKVDDDTLIVVNNHLESFKLTTDDKDVYLDMMNDPNKQKVKEGSRQLLRKLADPAAIRAMQADSIVRIVHNYQGEGIIVCGDFNDSPLSYARRVIGEQLDDAFVESGNGLGISYNRNRFYFRIDHILTSRNLEAYQCTVDRSIKASDHYPIWCYIAKKK